MKAIKLLLMDRHELGNPKIVTTEMFNEAIAELEEAMKPKTCDGCVYGVFGVDSFGIEIECTLAYRCSRGQNDMFKKKS